MKNIGSTLKNLREECGLTRREVAEKLMEYGFEISDKTIYGYESGRNSTNADMFLALCKIYTCTNILNVFEDTSDDILFTNSEWERIEKYRFISKHSPAGAKVIDNILDREHEIAKQLHEQKERIEELESAVSYSPAATRIYTYLHKIAAAGVGFYFEDIPTDTIEAPYLDGADFIVGVSGDSMEPTYYDGDLVYVQKRQIVETGDIGIFMANGVCVIKEAGENGLVSHNLKYPLIPGNDNIICFGKVIGKVPDLKS